MFFYACGGGYELIIVVALKLATFCVASLRVVSCQIVDKQALYQELQRLLVVVLTIQRADEDSIEGAMAGFGDEFTLGNRQLWIAHSYEKFVDRGHQSEAFIMK